MRITWSGRVAGCLLVLVITLPVAAQEVGTRWQTDELRRFPAAEARQGVAVDEAFVYAIDNHAIGKYDKATGRRVGGWTGAADGPIRHLNSGVVVGGRLYSAHSNYPHLPMTSSIEVFDTRTMEHVDSHSFGIYAGSGTWIDFYDGAWWMAFAHYSGEAAEPGKDPRWTTLVRFDSTWQQQEAWVFPDTVLARFAPYSNSGGAWGAAGLLYITGHDRREAYVLRLPEAGSVLELVDIVPVAAPGQGIAWDRSEAGILYGIDRAAREVVVMRVNRR